MNFFLLLRAIANHLTPPTPPSQSNQTPSSPAHPIQQGQLSDPIFPFPVRVPPSPAHPVQPEQDSNPNPPPPPRQNNLNPQAVLFPPSPDHAIQPEQQCPQSQSSNHSPPPGQSNSIPVYQIAFQPAQVRVTRPFPYQIGFQSPNHPLPPPPPPITTPWYRGNEFVAIEPAPNGPLPHEFHAMDRISLCVLNYLLACGLSHTSTWAQLPKDPNLSASIHIQSVLIQVALSLFLLANAVFPRIQPALAFVLDRLSFLQVVISAYLASMPMFPPYFAIIMPLVVIIVYIFARFRG